MSPIDPQHMEFIKRLCQPGYEPELVKETPWSYTFKTGPKHTYRISKFMADKNFKVNVSEIRAHWPTMSTNERYDFAMSVSGSEERSNIEILEFLLQEGDDDVWPICAMAFLEHPDRGRVVKFLIERVQQNTDEDPPLNYIQALGLAKDRRATAAILPYYEKCRAEMEAEKTTGVPENVVFGPIPYPDYFSICEALLKIEGSSEYEQAIRKYLDHPNEQVRYWAEHALEIEGPTTLKRKAEHAKKFAK
jgi:hypothetical protein